MTRSEHYAPWDVVAVPFPYTDRLAEKRRPALVVSKPHLQTRHGLVWLAMITSKGNSRWKSDVVIEDLDAAGLPAASVVRPVKIAVVDATRIARRLGTLRVAERAAVSAGLKDNLA